MIKSSELLFEITISNDAMVAKINKTPGYDNELHTVDESYILDIIKKYGITYGIDHQIIQKIIQNADVEYPIVIAKGINAVNGKDGEVIYESNFSTEVDRTEGYD